MFDHPKVFDSTEAANAWFNENGPEGVAFEYPVLSFGDDRRQVHGPQSQ
jgi:hypothetical protein